MNFLSLFGIKERTIGKHRVVELYVNKNLVETFILDNESILKATYVLLLNKISKLEIEYSTLFKSNFLVTRSFNFKFDKLEIDLYKLSRNEGNIITVFYKCKKIPSKDYLKEVIK